MPAAACVCAPARFAIYSGSLLQRYEGSLQDRYEATRIDAGSHAPMYVDEALPLWLHLARALQVSRPPPPPPRPPHCTCLGL